jgi:hypothetical protein
MSAPLPTIRLRLPSASEEEFKAKYATSLESEGIFVPSLNMRPVGTRVKLILELRSGEPALTSEAVVEKHAAPGSRPGMTLKLSDPVALDASGLSAPSESRKETAPELPASPAPEGQPVPWQTGEGLPPGPPANPSPSVLVEGIPPILEDEKTNPGGEALKPFTPGVNSTAEVPPGMPPVRDASEQVSTSPSEPLAQPPAAQPPSTVERDPSDYTQPYPQSLSDLLPQLKPLDEAPSGKFSLDVEVEEPNSGEVDIDLNDSGSVKVSAPTLRGDEGPTSTANPYIKIRSAPEATAEPPTKIDSGIRDELETSVKKKAPVAGPAWGAGEPDDDDIGLRPFRTRLDRAPVEEAQQPREQEAPEPPEHSRGSEPATTWLWVLFGTLVVACIAALIALVRT